MRGFVESLNVSVAAALVMQRLFELCPVSGGFSSVRPHSVLLFVADGGGAYAGSDQR